MTEKRFYKQKSTIEKYMLYDNDKEDAYFLSCEDESNIDYLVDLLNEQDQRIKELEEQLKLVCKADSLMAHDSVKEIIRDAIRGLDTVAENSSTAFDHYVVLDKVFKEQYNNEYWDNYE